MPQFHVQSGLPAYPAGLTDNDANLFAPIYRAISGVSQAVSIVTGNVTYSQGEMAQIDQLTKLVNATSSKIIVQAAEALAYGQMLSLSIVAGKITARVATATNLARFALAVCDQPGGIAAGAFGEAVFMSGRTEGIAGTTFGLTYYLSTAGNIQTAVPTATGIVNQIVGMGLGIGGFYLNIEPVGRRPAIIFSLSPTTLRVNHTDGSFVDIGV